MIDIQLRGAVLRYLYENRKNPVWPLELSKISSDLNDGDLIRICDQLHEHGLVIAKSFNALSGGRVMLECRISARGVDVVETGASPDLRIDLMSNQNITISGSSNIVVGNNNQQYIQQSVQHSVEELLKVINASNGTGDQKEEAKGLLRSFLEHPLLAAAASAAIGLLGS